MYYYIEVPIPANTPAATPKIDVVRVTSGVSREVWVMFPDGPYGLAHMQIWHHNMQVWPWDPHTSFHWNYQVFHIEDRFPFSAEPYELVIKTWNLDDSYLHHVTFAMTLDPLPPPTEMADLTGLLQELGLQ